MRPPPSVAPPPSAARQQPERAGAPHLPEAAEADQASLSRTDDAEIADVLLGLSEHPPEEAALAAEADWEGLAEELPPVRKLEFGPAAVVPAAPEAPAPAEVLADQPADAAEAASDDAEAVLPAQRLVPTATSPRVVPRPILDLSQADGTQPLGSPAGQPSFIAAGKVLAPAAAPKPEPTQADVERAVGLTAPLPPTREVERPAEKSDSEPSGAHAASEPDGAEDVASGAQPQHAHDSASHKPPARRARSGASGAA